MMAGINDDNSFRPISVREVSNDLPTDERAKVMTEVAENNRAIRLGYDHVNQKIKDVRQDYRRVVKKGRRSGSGHLMTDTWNLL